MHGTDGPATLVQRLPGSIATIPAADHQQHVAERLTGGALRHGERPGPADATPRLVDGVEEVKPALGGTWQRRVSRVDVDDLVGEAGDAARRRQLPWDLVCVALRQQLVLGALNVSLGRWAAADQVVFTYHLKAGSIALSVSHKTMYNLR